MRLFPIAALKLIKVLEKIGFKPLRQTGGHLIVGHPDGRSVPIPVHGEIRPALLNTILKQAKLNRDEFLKLLKEILILLGLVRDGKEITTEK